MSDLKMSPFWHTNVDKIFLVIHNNYSYRKYCEKTHHWQIHIGKVVLNLKHFIFSSYFKAKVS